MTDRLTLTRALESSSMPSQAVAAIVIALTVLFGALHY